MKLNIEAFSQEYQVKRIDQSRLQDVYMLCKSNPLYYQHMPPMITRKSIEDDMIALPPGKGYEDKYYVGFYKQDTLYAVMDFIAGYPDDKTAFIGFFMMDKTYQRIGAGSRLVQEIISYVKAIGYTSVQLAYVKGNQESEHFWKKNGFQPTGVEKDKGNHTIVRMQYVV